MAKFSNGHVMHMISEITMSKWYFSWYGYPTNQLLKTALSAAYQGAVLDMDYGEANSTYTAQFYGPTVQCQNMPSEILQDFNKSLDCDPRLTPHNSDDWCLYDPSKPATAHNRIIYAYLSWLPSEGEVVPYGQGNITNARLPLEAMRFGSYKGGPASMFIANRVRLDADEWNVLNCSFYNASFLANFSSDASKRVTPVIKDLEVLNPVSASIADPGWTEDTPLDPKNAVIFSYMSLMQCLCKILYGTIVSPVASEIPLINEGKVQQPDVLITGLGLSRELVQMRKSSLTMSPANDSNWIFPADQPTYPPDTKEADRFSEAWPTSDFYSPAFGRPLASSIEEMFHNMTLSLFSSPSFLVKSDVPVNVTTMGSHNIYIYSSTRLVLSYVIALVLALISSICGLLAIRHNGASYSNRISTFLRVAVQQDLYSLIPPDEQRGADPLPIPLLTQSLTCRGSLRTPRLRVWRAEARSGKTTARRMAGLLLNTQVCEAVTPGDISSRTVECRSVCWDCSLLKYEHKFTERSLQARPKHEATTRCCQRTPPRCPYTTPRRGEVDLTYWTLLRLLWRLLSGSECT